MIVLHMVNVRAQKWSSQREQMHCCGGGFRRRVNALLVFNENIIAG